MLVGGVGWGGEMGKLEMGQFQKNLSFGGGLGTEYWGSDDCICLMINQSPLLLPLPTPPYPSPPLLAATWQFPGWARKLTRKWTCSVVHCGTFAIPWFKNVKCPSFMCGGGKRDWCIKRIPLEKQQLFWGLSNPVYTCYTATPKAKFVSCLHCSNVVNDEW